MGALRSRPTTERRDRRYLGRTEDAEAPEVVRATGSRVVDALGRTWIDFQMGWCVGNLGWNPPEILARVHSFAGPSYVNPNNSYAPWTDLAERLVASAPGKLARAYRVTTGTEAVELALQLAVTRTGRRKFVSIEDAYHGNSVGARTVGSDDLDAHLPGVRHLAPPLDVGALDRLETMLKHRDVAAFIMEPVITNLSVMIPESDFMRDLVPLCHRYGTLVIMDEVACGLGRAGTMFACEHDAVEPDLLTIAKSLGGGIVPIATTFATADVADAARNELSFYASFGWMPLAVEAALAVLDYWKAHGNELLANIAQRASQIENVLPELFPDAELRIRGLAIGVGLDDEERVAAIAKRAKQRGLLVYPEDDSLVMFPALTIDKATCGEALDILATASS
jgi:acetylornithine/succinyldiaminopimelate/putrescine aminotransferase